MGIRGRQTPPAVVEFIKATYLNAPNLTYAQVVDRVVEKFGPDATIDKSSVGKILKREGINSPRGGEKAPIDGNPDRSTQLLPGIEVKIDADLNGWDIRPHISASLTIPIYFFFSIRNITDQVIQYAQLHVWVAPGMFWDPETPEHSIWSPQGPEKLPVELQAFEMDSVKVGSHDRWTARLTPEDRFALIPSDHLHALPPMVLIRRPWVGMLTMPWKIETPGLPSTFGGLLLWNGARFRIQQTGLTYDRTAASVLLDQTVEEYHTNREQERARLAREYEYSE